jgi:hypothetical protein
MKIYVPLEPHEVDRLCDIAETERRRPQDLAALYVARGLQAEAGNKALHPAAAAAPRAAGGAQ